MGVSLIGVSTSLAQLFFRGTWIPLMHGELNRIEMNMDGKFDKKFQEIRDSLPGKLEKEDSVAVMSRKSPGSSELGGDSKV
jgi:hypothetical protein